MTLRKLIATFVTTAAAVAAQAATYTTVFTQDFEDSSTYTAQFKGGKRANRILDLQDETLTDKLQGAVTQEERTRLDETTSKFWHNNGGTSGRNNVYIFPESAFEGLTSWKLDFDYYIAAGYDAGNVNGMSLITTTGKTLFTLFNNTSSQARIYKGDDIDYPLGFAFAIPGRGNDCTGTSQQGKWLHFSVVGNINGVNLTVTYANGDAILTDCPVSASAAEPIQYLFIRNFSGRYVSYAGLDDIVISSATPETYTWTGSAEDNAWSTLANWSVNGETPVSTPKLGDIVIIDQTALDAMDVAAKLLAAGENRVFVNTYPRTTKYWSGKGVGNDWFTVANWSYDEEGDVVATTVPAANDTLIFPGTFTEGITVEFSNSICDSDKPGDGYYFVANCDVLMKGKNSASTVINPYSVIGNGRLALSDIQLRTKTSKGSSSLETPLEIAGSTIFYLRGGSAKIYFKNAVTGSGTMVLNGDTNTSKAFSFQGDMSSFEGVMELKFDSSKSTCELKGDDATCNLSGAAVSIASSSKLTLNSTTTAEVLKIGGLTGGGTINNGRSSAMTLEVGGLNGESTSAVTLANSTVGLVWTVKKVGTGTQALTGCDGFNVDLTAGDLVVTNGAALGTIAANGGKLEFAADASWTDGESHLLFTYTGTLPEGDVANYVYANNAALGGSYLPSYDATTTEGSVSVTFTKSSITWVGGENGLWSDAANWTVAGVPAENPPTASDAVTIPAGAVIIIGADQTMGSVSIGAGVTFKVQFTDESLTYTIPESVAGATFVAVGPYEATTESGVMTATRVPTTFVWTEAKDTAWGTLGNWTVAGLPPAVLPGSKDEVIFGSRESGNWTVEMGGERVVSNVVFNAATLMTGETLRPYFVGGEGKIIFGNKFKLAHASAALTINNPVEVVAENAENRAWFYIPSAYTITMNGDITGSGFFGVLVKDKVNYSGVDFTGDLRAFTGNMSAPANDIDRNQTSFKGENSWSDQATFELSCGGGNTILCQGNTFKFGSFKGKMNCYDHSAGQKMTVEIGNLNADDDAIGGTLFKSSYPNLTASRGHTIRKVGTGTLEVSVINNKAYEVQDGVMRLMNDRAYRTMWKPSGSASEITTDPTEATGTNFTTIAFTGTGTLALHTDFTEDISASILNSTGAISLDDGGQNRAWATALASSNVGGLVKKGAGTLTLTATESETLGYEGYTRVEAGKLAIAEGTHYTWDITSPVALASAVEGATPTAYGVGTAQTNWVYGVNSWSDAAQTVDLTNLKAIDLTSVTEIAKGQKFTIMTAKAFQVNGAAMGKDQRAAITVELNDAVKTFAAEKGYVLKIEGNDLVYAPRGGFALIVR